MTGNVKAKVSQVPPLSMSFHVLKVDAAGDRVLHLPTDANARLLLERMFDEQRSRFVESLDDAVPFHAGFNPGADGESDLCFIEFVLPDSIKNVIGKSDQIETLSDADLSGDAGINAVFAVDFTVGRKHAILFQRHQRSQVLKRSGALSIVWHGDAFTSLAGAGLSMRPQLDAMWVDDRLYFSSFFMVRRFLALDGVFAEATNEEIVSCLGHEKFASSDPYAVIAVSDQWMRRRFTMINNGGIMDAIDLGAVEKVCKRIRLVGVFTGKGDDRRLVLPQDKKRLKMLLRVLSQEYVKCLLTGSEFRSNSKIPIG